MSDICIYIREKYNIIYTIGGVTNWLKSNDLSYKKPKGVPLKADPKEQDKFIHEYKLILQKSLINESILFTQVLAKFFLLPNPAYTKFELFIDGIHPTMETKITYGWIRTGQNKPIATTASRTCRNLLGTINLKTMRVEVKSYTTIN